MNRKRFLLFREILLVLSCIWLGRVWGLSERITEAPPFSATELFLDTSLQPTELFLDTSPLREKIKTIGSDEEKIKNQPPRSYNGIFEGDIIDGEITHYDVCVKCCGKTDGVTASGFVIQNGVDDPYIAACNWLPFGAVIAIDGVEYTIRDRGGRGLSTFGRIDVFVPGGHAKALELGRKQAALVVVSLPASDD